MTHPHRGAGPRHGDFSRAPHRPGDYAGVLMQQGRVQLDSDWNEQALLQAELRGQALRDLVGPHGGPEAGGGFRVSLLGGQPFRGDDDALLIDARTLRDSVNGFELELEFETAAEAREGQLLSLREAEKLPPYLTLALRADGALVLTLDAHAPQQTGLSAAPGGLRRICVAISSETTALSLDGRAFRSERRRERPLGLPLIQLGAGEGRASFVGWAQDLCLREPSGQDLGRFRFDRLDLAEHERWTPATLAPSPIGALAAAAPRDLVLSAGRYYVDGDAVALPEPTRFTAQPDLPGAVFDPSADGAATLVFLEVSERTVTAIQSPSLSESALGGLDTSVRTKTLAQVRTLAAGHEPEKAWADFERAARAEGRMAARRDPAWLAAPLENLLYRVEIHAAAGNPATFKWSRLNGAATHAIRSVDRATGALRLEALRRDRLHLRPGDWIELLNDRLVALAQPGPLRQVADIDARAGLVTLAPPAELPEDLGAHPFLRRWDQTPTTTALIGGATPAPQDSSWVELENGVQVAFADGPLRAGDYWTFAARTGGGVIWPQRDGAPDWVEPDGIGRRCAPIAMLRKVGSHWHVEDRRRLFPDVTIDAFMEHGGVVHGNVSVHGWMEVRHHLKGETLQGLLTSPDSVPRLALQDGVVDRDKLDPELGCVPLGGMILTEGAQPPAGYAATHHVLELRAAEPKWRPLGAIKTGGGGHVQAVVADGQIAVNVGGETFLFTPRGGHFHPLPALPSPRRDAAFAAVGDRLFLIGGVSGDEPSAEVWSLRLGESAWARAPDLPLGLTQAGAAGAGVLLYVAGGVGRWGPLPWTSAEVWRYDTRKDIWSQAPSLPARVRRPALAAAYDDVYALGGLRCAFPFALRPSDRVWRLPAGGSRWRADRPLGERAAHPAAACAEGRLFEAGASGHTRELQIQAGFWTGLPSLPAPAGRVALAAIHGELLAFHLHGKALDAFGLPIRTRVHVQRWKGMAPK